MNEWVLDPTRRTVTGPQQVFRECLQNERTNGRMNEWSAPTFVAAEGQFGAGVGGVHGR